MGRWFASTLVILCAISPSLAGQPSVGGEDEDGPVKIKLDKLKGNITRAADDGIEVEGTVRVDAGATPPEAIVLHVDKEKVSYGVYVLKLNQDDKGGKFVKKEDGEYRYASRLAVPKSVGKYEIFAEGLCIVRDASGNVNVSKVTRPRSPKGTTIEVK